MVGVTAPRARSPWVGMSVWDVGVRVWGVGVRMLGVGLRVWGVGLRVRAAPPGALPGVPEGASDVELEGASADDVVMEWAAAGIVEGAGDVVLASPPFLAGVSGAERGCC